MEYKYKIGDEVYYRAVETSEKVCPTCEHVDYEYENVERGGKIVSRGRDYLVTSEPDMLFTHTTQRDGSTLIAPQVPEIKPAQKENFYTINGDMVCEGNILSLS